MVPNAQKDILIAVDLGNSKTKIIFDIGDVSNRHLGPRCFKAGPRELDPMETMLLYKDSTVVSSGSEALVTLKTNPNFVPCTNFMWLFKQHYSSNSNDSPDPKAISKTFIWHYPKAKVIKNPDDLLVDFLRGLPDTHLHPVAFDGRWTEDSGYKWKFLFSIPCSTSNADKEEFEKTLDIWRVGRLFEVETRRQAEAVAVYAIKEREKAGEKIRYRITGLTKEENKKHAYAVADIGYTNTEIISFHLKRLNPIIEVKPTAVKLIHDPFGGSDTIKRAFINYLRDGIDEPFRSAIEDSPDEHQTVQNFLYSVENHPDGLKVLYVKLCGMTDRHKDNRGGFLHITEVLLQTFTQKCAERALIHLLQHIKAAEDLGVAIQFVVLVGGASLSKTIERHLSHGLLELDIPVWCHKRAATATPRGMIIQAQQELLLEHNGIRACYGIQLDDYISVDGHSDGRYHWIFEKGESYSSKVTRTLRVLLKRKQTSFRLTIVRYTGHPTNRSLAIRLDAKTPGCILKSFTIKVKYIDLKRRSLFQISRCFGPKLMERTFDLTFELEKYELRVKLECDGRQRKIIGAIDDLMEPK